MGGGGWVTRQTHFMVGPGRVPTKIRSFVFPQQSDHGIFRLGPITCTEISNCRWLFLSFFLDQLTLHVEDMYNNRLTTPSDHFHDLPFV